MINGPTQMEIQNALLVLTNAAKSDDDFRFTGSDFVLLNGQVMRVQEAAEYLFRNGRF